MKLQDLQKSFIDSLLGNDSRKLRTLICDDNSMTADERIAVYLSNTTYTLLRTLQQIYPLCCRILGEDYFKQVARAYIKRYPSRHSDLNCYGEHLPDLLVELIETHDELSDFAYLPDLAKMESYLHMAYNTADDPFFDFKTFEKTVEQGGEEIYFLLSDSLALLESVYPLLEIWELNQNTEQAESVSACEEREYLCIHRQHNKPRIGRISQPHYDLLQAINDGVPLNQLAERFDFLDSELPAIIKSGWVCGFTTSKPPAHADKAF